MINAPMRESQEAESVMQGFVLVRVGSHEEVRLDLSTE